MIPEHLEGVHVCVCLCALLNVLCSCCSLMCSPFVMFAKIRLAGGGRTPPDYEKKRPALFSLTKQNVNHWYSCATWLSVWLMEDGRWRSKKQINKLIAPVWTTKTWVNTKKPRYTTICQLINAVVVVVLIICCESPSASLTRRQSCCSKANT